MDLLVGVDGACRLPAVQPELVEVDGERGAREVFSLRDAPQVLELVGQGLNPGLFAELS